MRNPLHKRLPREFRKNAGRYIGMLLILICTILIGSSFQVTMDSVQYTITENDRECCIEDGQFETAAMLPGDMLEDLRKEDLLIAENFYTTVNNYEDTAKILIFDERKVMNLPSVFEGTLPQKENEIAVDRLFAANRGIQVGDRLTLQGRQFEVSATISLPDYSALFKSNQDLVMNTADFGVAVVTEEGFSHFQEDTLTYHYSYRFRQSGLTQSEEREILESLQKELLQKGVILRSFLTAEKNQSISFLREDMGKDGPMVRVFIYILILIIAFVFAVLTTNTIESEAAIIGTLRALGYTKGEILAHYLSPTLLIALISAAVGNALGYTVMLRPFEDMYYTSYCIPPMKLRFNPEAFVTTTIVPILIMILLNGFMLYNKLSLSPLKFLRKDLHKRKQKKAVRLPELSFIKRFRIRVILQNMGSFCILFLGIFLSSFLLMFGIGLAPLMEHYVDEIDQTLPYDYQYVLKAPIEAENGEKMEQYVLKTRYELGNTEMDVTFMGIADDTTYFADIQLPKEADEITLTLPLAKKLQVKAGDTLLFWDDYYDKEYSLKVSAVCEYNSCLGAFMRQQTLNQMLGNAPDTYNCYVSDEKLQIDERYLAKYITRADLIGAAEQMMKSFHTVILFINLFSVLIYIVLMYILTKTVIEKNALAISFMKVFGYNPREISRLYLDATTITVLTALVVCIPLEALCFRYAVVYISSLIEGYIEFYLPGWVYGAILAIGMVAYFSINMLHIHKVRKIPMSEALKNRE